MATDSSPTVDAPKTDDEDQPSVRQLLHSATGDRDAEAKALADRSDDDVTEADAKLAVERAHGDVHGAHKPDRDEASPEDATAMKDEDGPRPDRRA